MPKSMKGKTRGNNEMRGNIQIYCSITLGNRFNALYSRLYEEHGTTRGQLLEMLLDAYEREQERGGDDDKA